eukprot:scaffold11797_cov123-Isochrysis_galbana.AAC.7
MRHHHLRGACAQLVLIEEITTTCNLPESDSGLRTTFSTLSSSTPERETSPPSIPTYRQQVVPTVPTTRGTPRPRAPPPPHTRRATPLSAHQRTATALP